MDKLWVHVSPKPEHTSAVGAEVAFGRTCFFLVGAAVLDGDVFPVCFASVRRRRRRRNKRNILKPQLRLELKRQGSRAQYQM